MYIFVDEAGGFQVPSNSKGVCCIGALIVPESVLVTLLRKMRRLTRPWRAEGREVKGSQLLETQMAQVLATVRRFDVLFVVVAIDMALHSDAGVSRHRETQAKKFLDALSDKMALPVRFRTEGLAARLRALPNQLYVQSVLLTMLVEAVLTASTLYYSQRLPKALSHFHWRLDAKDVAITRYELLWRDVVGPFLQTQSLSSPLPMLKGADYSSFQRFCGEQPVPPGHLRPHVRAPDDAFAYVDIEELLADLRFCSSARYTGLQAVDMLASAVRRACNGSLETKGWKGLGRLMPRPRRGTHAIRFLALEDVGDPEVSYADVVRQCDLETKRMILAEAE
jgi:hypothetical protein